MLFELNLNYGEDIRIYLHMLLLKSNVKCCTTMDDTEICTLHVGHCLFDCQVQWGFQKYSCGSEFLSYEIELHKMTSHFELLSPRLNVHFSIFRLLTQSWKIIKKVSLWVTNSNLKNKKFLVANPELTNKRFYFKLLTCVWKISFT